MKHFKFRLLALCGLVMLAVASLAPVMGDDSGGCPLWVIECPKGPTCSCAGTPEGTYCKYDEGCINGNCCYDLIE